MSEQQPLQRAIHRPKPMNGMAIASFWTGWVTVVTSIVPFMNFFALVMAPIGIFFGVFGVRQIKASAGAMLGMRRAVSGIVLNVIGMAATIAFLVMMLSKA